jgi:hypothetical protein
MGRTGRKREGRVVFLLTEGKEERDHIKSQDAYEKIQKKIASGNDFEFNLDNSPRILPREYQPDCIKQHITPPDETLEALELKIDKRKKLPKKKRDWTLPENVETGFVRVSTLTKRKREENREFVDPDTLVSPFLSKEDEKRVREKRVAVSLTPRMVRNFDMESSVSIPVGSVRNRLIRTRKAMNDSTRSQRTYTEDDMEELTSTPTDLIVSSLSERDVSAKPDSPPTNKLFEGIEDDFSSADDLPELSTALLFNKTSKSSDDEYGLPGDFQTTPRKKIKIVELSDEE